MSLSSTISEIPGVVRYWSKIVDFNLPNFYLVPLMGVIRWNFVEIIDIRKLGPWAIAWGCLCNPCHLGRTLTCDRQTDTQ